MNKNIASSITIVLGAFFLILSYTSIIGGVYTLWIGGFISVMLISFGAINYFNWRAWIRIILSIVVGIILYVIYISLLLIQSCGYIGFCL